MNSTKDTHDLQKETRDSSRGLEEKEPRRSTSDPLRYHCATLINRKSTTVQAPRSRHAGVWESESCPTNGKISAKWCAQVTTRFSINSNRKVCIEVL